jgi:hypothetical protein
MASQPVKRLALGCISIVFIGLMLVGLSNWIGSGKAIKVLRESIDSVDAAQTQNASRNLGRIQELEEEVKKLKGAAEDETTKERNLQNKVESLEEEIDALKRR